MGEGGKEILTLRLPAPAFSESCLLLSLDGVLVIMSKRRIPLNDTRGHGFGYGVQLAIVEIKPQS